MAQETAQDMEPAGHRGAGKGPKHPFASQARRPGNRERPGPGRAPTLLFWGLLGALLLVVGSRVPARPEPTLAMDPSVAPDLQALAQETWARFLAAFPAQRGCIRDVTLVADPDLSDRAVYHVPTATVRVKVPGSAARLRAALVHEWAHHLEITCPAHRELRPAFLRSLGLPVEAPWFQGQAWEATPSEIYAEAAVELVLGSRSMPTKARVPSAAVERLRVWAQAR